MLDSAFSSVFGTADSLVSSVSTVDFLICCVASILLGAAVAGVYMFRHTYSKNFVVTLALLPLIVQMVITLVNGNLGAGIAVMGVFNLVRFRSIPGSAKDIGSVFLAMAAGLAAGTGYLVLALALAAGVSLLSVLLLLMRFGEMPSRHKALKITIPESLDYTGVFDDIFRRYTSRCELVSVRTTNMGSLYRLQYHVLMRSGAHEKEFIDELRCRNGNLEIALGRMAAEHEEL